MPRRGQHLADDQEIPREAGVSWGLDLSCAPSLRDMNLKGWRQSSVVEHLPNTGKALDTMRVGGGVQAIPKKAGAAPQAHTPVSLPAHLSSANQRPQLHIRKTSLVREVHTTLALWITYHSHNCITTDGKGNSESMLFLAENEFTLK